YGECSSHPQYSQADVGIYDNQPDLYGVDINSVVQDGYNGETNHNENPLNFSFASEDPDLYFDASAYLASLDTLKPTIMSTGFSQTDVNSPTMVPLFLA
ncbi:NAC domain-containing protein 78-like, partial [Trifolium medium]|nr:NAC domain-containing protein 78-like [Trifolium medium]